MRISNKCSMALHILLVLAAFPRRKPTSDQIAGSVGCNPVMVRGLLSKLKDAGIIATSRGVGGSTLLKDPEDITVWTVYRAVDADSFEHLIGLHPTPYQQCPVGKNIYAILEKPYDQIKDAIRAEMESITLGQLVEEFRQRVDA